MTNNIGKCLFELREGKGKEKQDLSIYLGITDRSYGRYESGERTPDVDTLVKLAEYYGCSVDYLLGRDEKKFSNLISRDQAFSYKDLTDKGYNGKLAHGLIKQIIDKQSYPERVHVTENDSIKYVSKEAVRSLLMKMLADLD